MFSNERGQWSVARTNYSQRLLPEMCADATKTKRVVRPVQQCKSDHLCRCRTTLQSLRSAQPLLKTSHTHAHSHAPTTPLASSLVQRRTTRRASPRAACLAYSATDGRPPPPRRDTPSLAVDSSAIQSCSLAVTSVTNNDFTHRHTPEIDRFD